MKIKLNSDEKKQLQKSLKERWNELHFKQGFGKLTAEGVWHIGQSEVVFEAVLDQNGQATDIFEAIVKNKMSFKGIQSPKHNTHFQRQQTGIFCQKEADTNTFVSLKFRDKNDIA